MRAAIRSVGAAQAAEGAEGTEVLDSAFDDQAVRGEGWDQGHHLLGYRPGGARHRDRLVRLVRLAEVATEMVVQKVGQPRRLLDHLAPAAILADAVRRHGALPPRIAALLGRSPALARLAS